MAEEPRYGKMASVEEIGALARAHRKKIKLAQVQIAGLSNTGTRFLSEFERGKSTVGMGKVLKVLQTLGLEIVVRERESWLQHPFFKNEN